MGKKSPADTKPRHALLRTMCMYILVILCVSAVLLGWTFYVDQLAITPPLLRIVVPDCPLFVFLSLPIVLGLLRKDLYSFIVSIGVAKYGLWTVSVLFFYNDFYFAPDMLTVTAVFILGHIGMALLGAALIPKKKLAATALVLALAIFLLNDYADYFLGTHPFVPNHDIELLRNFTFASSLAFSLGFFYFGRYLRNLPTSRFLRWVMRID